MSKYPKVADLRHNPRRALPEMLKKGIGQPYDDREYYFTSTMVWLIHQAVQKQAYQEGKPYHHRQTTRFIFTALTTRAREGDKEAKTARLMQSLISDVEDKEHIKAWLKVVMPRKHILEKEVAKKKFKYMTLEEALQPGNAPEDYDDEYDDEDDD